MYHPSVVFYLPPMSFVVAPSWLTAFYAVDLIGLHAIKQMEINGMAERILDLPGFSLFSRWSVTANIALSLMPIICEWCFGNWVFAGRVARHCHPAYFERL
ncbi:hypothetical protein F5146DRAFT_330700 [Armillaria mellea]|nr:hypothetical protein F5146DRAFT_330700 [Armillaria mellea]